jgi:hypothetical protein
MTAWVLDPSWNRRIVSAVGMISTTIILVVYFLV